MFSKIKLDGGSIMAMMGSTSDKFGTWQRYIFFDVEPITAMMDPTSEKMYL